MNYNVVANLTRQAETRPEHLAIAFESNRWSYDDLNKAVSATATVLQGAGVKRGDRVAILGLNSDEYVIAQLAAGRLGAVSVLLNYRLTAEELKYLLGDSEPVALLLDEEFLSMRDGLLDSTPSISFSALMHTEANNEDSLRHLRSTCLGVDLVDEPMDVDDLDRILYTSGTTSRPKGVMLTHGNAWWNALTMMMEGCCSSDERTLVFAPLYHIGAQDLPGTRVFAVGGTMVIMRRFDVEGVLRQIQESRITGMVLVSTMIHMLVDLPTRMDFDTSSLRWMIFGQVPENMLLEVRKIFPHAAIKNSYGLTEVCSMATTIDDDNQRRFPLSPGRPVATLQMRIVNDDGTEVEQGKLGEILLRGPKVMRGYWRLPDVTTETLKDGWLHTGDVGYLDENGFLYVVDRKKDMIRTGGENVSSQEVERVIYEMGTVAEVAVVPQPDEKWGEIIKAVVVPRPGETITEEQVVTHCRVHLASYKQPRVVEFRSELPRNPSGKVLKRELQ
jgi:acyl-CoA synthetase (AMP-forming)/AMP-acid ligase II